MKSGLIPNPYRTNIRISIETSKYLLHFFYIIFEIMRKSLIINGHKKGDENSSPMILLLEINKVGKLTVVKNAVSISL